MKISDNTRGLLYAVAAGFLWSILAVIIKVLLHWIPPKTIAWGRFCVAFGFLFIYFIIYRRKQLKIFLRPPVLVILSALALGSNYILFMEGINITTPNNAAIFIQVGPLLLAVIGFIFYKEKLRPVQIAGFAIAIVGFLFFYKDQFRNLFSQTGNYNIGVLYIILAGVMWAIYSVLQKELVKKYVADDLNLINFGLPALLLLGGADIHKLSEAPWYAIGILIFLGLNTLLAYRFLSLALKYTEANKISIILTSNPTITFIAMAILTSLEVSWIEGEIFALLSIVGAILVILGAVIVSVFNERK